VIRDEAGSLYGTTNIGGVPGGCGGAGCGTVYKVNPANELTVLYTFTTADAASPGYSGVVRDSDGNFYGTAGSAGSGNWGMVYKLSPAGQETVLYRFTGESDGGCPTGVIRDREGSLYGTTQRGGSAGGFGGAGVVYKVNPSGHQTVLHTFTGGADGGFFPSGVIRDSAGNLYGTTNYGGDLSASACVGYGCGVVYKLGQSGNDTVLYNFTGGTDGGFPYAGVIRDPAGNLYGAAFGGDLSTSCFGGYGCGVVYKLDTSGKKTVLYSFTGGTDGSSRASVLKRDPAGNLYGTALEAGDLAACSGNG
jgi:uncharacterized repeat protein (TIGR03803 family)